MSRTGNPSLTPFAQELRRGMTKQERRLWYAFLKTLPVTFNRQKVFGPYILDFYCASERLVVEVDGSQHYDTPGSDADRRRDEYLSSFGLRVLRYSNADVNKRFRAVCEDIVNHISAIE